MIIYPAIDLRKGRCVRLQRGEVTAETVFADDPVEAALRWVSQGATWLHVVNLDAALAGTGSAQGEGLAATSNGLALRRILEAAQVQVQYGGGLRTQRDIEEALGLGVARAILGTSAVRNPELVQEALAHYGPERVCVGIDARHEGSASGGSVGQGTVAIQGWVQSAGMDALSLARRMAGLGVSRVVYTDIGRDGMLGGANVEATWRLARGAGVQVIASGGVATLDDIRRLAEHEVDGVEGVIVGMALYRGAIQLPQALEMVERGR